jgi:hypothetical protein
LSAQVANPTGLGTPSAEGAARKAIARLQEIVEAETAALCSGIPVDLNDFTARKSQGLLDLTRALRQLGPASGAVPAQLAALRGKLETNHAVLKRHVEAVREVVTIIEEAIRDAESDGTYAPRHGVPAGP